MARVLLDSDVLIDHFRTGADLAVRAGEGAYSTITRAELYAGRGVAERGVDVLLSALEEIPVTRPIAERAGRIRRESGIPLPDALIAATAIATGRSLLTRNTRDFAGIRGLRLHPSS